MTAGRPATYTTKEELEKEIDRYFVETQQDEIAITGLALFLWFTSRQALINYQEKEEFVDTIKRAKMRVELAYEKRLIARGNGWDVFALKNFDWTDKQELDTRNLNIETTPKELAEMSDEELQALLK